MWACVTDTDWKKKRWIIWDFRDLNDLHKNMGEANRISACIVICFISILRIYFYSYTFFLFSSNIYAYVCKCVCSRVNVGEQLSLGRMFMYVRGNDYHRKKMNSTNRVLIVLEPLRLGDSSTFRLISSHLEYPQSK